MALSLVKNQTVVMSPHRQALRDNLKAIKEARAQVMTIHERDLKAQADVAAADATQARINALQEEVDTARAEAAYANAAPPDLRNLERQLADAQLLFKKQSDVSRAAIKIRAKYAADMQAFNDTLSSHVRHTKRLLWLTLHEEELAGLAAEYLAKEQQMLDISSRVFAAALACDVLAREQSFGEFSGSANINDLHIPRPAHPAFAREALTVEQGHAQRREYLKSIETAAAALELQLLAVAD